MGCVYEATNLIDGTRYIGLTMQKMSRRIKGHVDKVRHEGSDTHFHRALRKYGPDNFGWTVLHECADREVLATLEQQLIAQRRSEGVALYNITDGGDGAVGFTAEMRQRISDKQRGRPAPNKGVPHSEETRRKISEANRGRPNWRKGVKGGVPHNKGKPHSPETRQKIAEKKRARDAARKATT